MLKLLGLTGPAGCGKTTAADYIRDRYGLSEFQIGAKIKAVLETIFGFPPGHCDEMKRPGSVHQTLPGGISMRSVLQTLGTDWGRNTIDPDLWLEPLKQEWDRIKVDRKYKSLNEVAGMEGIVVSDVRFENEAKWIRDNGGCILHINCEGLNLIAESVHESEKGIDINFGSDHDLVVHNSIFDPGQASLAKFCRNIDDAWHKSILVSGPYSQEFQGSSCMNAISRDITEWANSVYPNRTTQATVAKLVLEEIPEWLNSDTNDPMEFADMVILILDLANMNNIDIVEAVKLKMSINKNRKWKIDPITNTMSHIKSLDECSI